jgi:hypothetical protein
MPAPMDWPTDHISRFFVAWQVHAVCEEIIRRKAHTFHCPKKHNEYKSLRDLKRNYVVTVKPRNSDI